MKTNFTKEPWLSVEIIVASVVIAAAALAYLSYDLNARAGKVISMRGAIQSNTAALDRLAGLQHDAPLAEAYQTAINTILPTQAGLIGIPSEAETLAEADGVTATLKFPQNSSEPPAGSLGATSFSLDVQGSPSSTTLFLADLETKATGFIIDLNSFTVANSGESGTHLTGQGMLYFQ